ncbi:MAG: hypothetical protein NT029_06255 [Armatimonadetes bacterium]|nr:hypothetical protein [Armatimonadota bacterium]
MNEYWMGEAAEHVVNLETRTQEQLKQIAESALPERLQDVVREGEVLSVRSWAAYNHDTAWDRPLPPDGEPQRPTLETAQLSVVEVRLGRPLDAAILHRDDRFQHAFESGDADAVLRRGSFFGEFAPGEGHTVAEGREAFAIPSLDKAYAAMGAIEAGSVVMISEVAPSEAPEWYSASPAEPDGSDAYPIFSAHESRYAEHNTPPLDMERRVPTYQFELVSGRFTPNDSWRLKPDDLH